MKPTLFKSTFAAALALAVTTAFAADSKIATIMKTVMKGDNSTYKAVCLGKGTEADAQKLVNTLKGLAGTTPPRGDAKSWKEMTSALIQAAEDVAAKKPGAATALQKAGNCKACHSEHKKE